MEQTALSVLLTVASAHLQLTAAYAPMVSIIQGHSVFLALRTVAYAPPLHLAQSAQTGTSLPLT